MNAKDREELAVMNNEISHVKKDVEDIKKMLTEHINREEDNIKTMTEKFVNKDQFLPVKNIVYGLVGIILTSVLGILLLSIMK